MDLALVQARVQFDSLAVCSPDFLAYVREQHLDQAAFAPFIGMYAVTGIVDCGQGRFDFSADGEPAFVLEAFDATDEQVIDLVAWPLSDPSRVLSLFGRCGLLGLARALNPATFFMGGNLTVYRTPLEWLQAGCNGAAIVTPSVAAHRLVEVPGPIKAADMKLAQTIRTLRLSVLDRAPIMIAEAA